MGFVGGVERVERVRGDGCGRIGINTDTPAR
jgi:hypothetical protein